MKKITPSSIYNLEAYHQVPLIVRCIALPPGLFLAYFLIVICLDKMGVNPAITHQLGPGFNFKLSWVALLVLFILTVFFLGLWFTNKHIYLDTEKNCIVAKGRFFFVPWLKETNVAHIVSVGYWKTSRRTGYMYDIFIRLQDQTKDWIARRYRESDAEEFLQTLSTHLQKPIERD